MENQTDGEKIASALLEVAHALKLLGNNDADTRMGAIEALGKEVKGVAESLNGMMEGAEYELRNLRESVDRGVNRMEE